MLSQLITIGLLMLFSSMLPGPDFALVTHNTLFHSRRAGLFTSLGVGSAILVHITYCVLGLAIIISQSIVIFKIIKYIGAIYLIYLGVKTFSAESKISFSNKHQPSHIKFSNFKAFKQGFLCNLLNPKATLFFLALFTTIIKPDTAWFWEIIFALEMFIVITAWFCFLSLILSHPKSLKTLNKIEWYIPKLLGFILIAFGTTLVFI